MDSTLCLFGFVAVQALCVVMLRVGRMAGSLSLRLGLETAALRLRFLVLATAQASLCAYPAHFLLSCGGCATDDNSSDFAETQPARWAFLGFRHPLRSLSSCSARLRTSITSSPCRPCQAWRGRERRGRACRPPETRWSAGWRQWRPHSAEQSGSPWWGQRYRQ